MNADTQHLAGEAAPQDVFTRRSSGFVREVGMGSSLAVNLMTMSLAFAVLAVTTIPSSFPGASTIGSVLIATAIIVFPIIMYALFSVAMPRSGGDYVFISRSISPWAGFAASFNATMWYILFAASLAYLVPQFGLSTAFANLSVTTNSHTLADMSLAVLKHGWTFGIGFACLLLIALIMSLNVRVMLTIVKGLFVLAVVGVVVALLILLFNDRQDFERAVAANGGSYIGIVRASTKAGFTGVGASSLSNTFLAIPLIFYSLGYAFLTAFIGGEVKSPIGDIYAKLGAYVLGAFLLIITVILADHTLGSDFLGGATYLSTIGSKAYPFLAPANYFFFVGLLTHSTLLVGIMGFSFVAAILATLVPTFLVTTRPLFAWSFDRLIPDKVSEVNERTRAPIIANTIVLVLATGYLALITFGSQTFTKVVATVVLGTVLTFCVVAIAAAVYPYTRREKFELSPVRSLVSGRLFTGIAVVSLVVYVFVGIALFTSNSLGANSTQGKIALAIICGLSLIVYPIAYYVNRGRGVDISLAGKDLPPE
jgi:amino acid transporter